MPAYVPGLGGVKPVGFDAGPADATHQAGGGRGWGGWGGRGWGGGGVGVGLGGDQELLVQTRVVQSQTRS